jgi:hypothetical protein
MAPVYSLLYPASLAGLANEIPVKALISGDIEI